MTYIIGVRCDLCGKTVTEPYSGQVHKLPEGWGDITMHYPVDGPNNQMREVCPECSQALYKGRTVIESYLDGIKPGPLLPVTESKIINLNRRE